MSEEKSKRNVERHAWRNAIHRCHNAQHKSYPQYGGRGIRVCDEWRAKEGGFEAFLAHIGPRPSSDHSLDRIDVNGHYEPGNVAWSTRQEQQLNRRIHFGPKGPDVTINGETRSVAEWSRLTGINGATIASRVREGRSDEEILHKGRLARRNHKQNRNIPGLYL